MQKDYPMIHFCLLQPCSTILDHLVLLMVAKGPLEVQATFVESWEEEVAIFTACSVFVPPHLHQMVGEPIHLHLVLKIFV